jgi:NTP pyrophosphatase (non-canonical NTP hydrolase)
MKSWKFLYRRLVENDPELQSLPWYRLIVLINQVGSLDKAVTYRYYEGESSGHLAEIKLSLADLLAQTFMMALNERIELGDLMELAYARLEDFIQNRLPHGARKRKQAKIFNH